MAIKLVITIDLSAPTTGTVETRQQQSNAEVGPGDASYSGDNGRLSHTEKNLLVVAVNVAREQPLLELENKLTITAITRIVTLALQGILTVLKYSICWTEFLSFKKVIRALN